jgi:hypothetical protein
MDRVESAARQYARIKPKGEVDWPGTLLRKAKVWLRDYVCPAVEELLARPPFRELARWPLDVLAPTSLSNEGGLLGSVDCALVQAARALVKIAEDEKIGQHLREQKGPKECVIQESVRIDGTGTDQVKTTRGLIGPLEEHAASIQSIAEHRYAELVSPEDFFRVRSGLIPTHVLANLSRSESSSVTDGAIVPFLNPELRPVGDFITRAMFHRIDRCMESLQTYRTFCLRAIAAAGPRRAPCGWAIRNRSASW